MPIDPLDSQTRPQDDPNHGPFNDKFNPPPGPDGFNQFMASMFTTVLTAVMHNQRDQADFKNLTDVFCELIAANPSLNEKTAVELAVDVYGQLKRSWLDRMQP